MAKIVLFFLFLAPLAAIEPFEQHCLGCHSKLNISFEKFYMQYLINYSSKNNIKEAMFYYLRDPNKEQSVMEPFILKVLGIMPKPKIDDRLLKEMIDIYMERFDLRKKLH